MTGRAAWDRAWVVFSGRADWWPLRLLKPGFRHCFLVLEGGGAWLACDPMLHRTDLALLRLPPGSDPVRAYVEAGLVVVEAALADAPRRLCPIRPYSCVEAVKRLLGIHDGFIFTPWQLYRHLSGARNK